MVGRRENLPVSAMYTDFSTDKTLEEKIEWMKERYLERMGMEARVVFIPTTQVAEDVLLGLTVIKGAKGLQENHFVLCQKPEDFLATKGTPFQKRR